MPITFKREFIINQLSLALSNTGEPLDDRVQLEIDNRKRQRDETAKARVDLVESLSKVKYDADFDDVRRAVGAIYDQQGRVLTYLAEALPTDEKIKQQVVNQYGNQQGDRAKLGYKRALDTLKASNAENVSFTDLKQLQILGIESYAIKAIEAPASDTDEEGVTAHTEE
jgi:hypothetical protein